MRGGDHERWVKANMKSTLESGTAVGSANWRTELDRSYDLSWKVECKEHPFFWEEQELWAGFFNFLLIYSLILILWDNTFYFFLINYSQVFASISMYAWYTCWHSCVYVCWVHVHVCAMQVEASVWCWVSSSSALHCVYQGRVSTVYIKAGSLAEGRVHLFSLSCQLPPEICLFLLSSEITVGDRACVAFVWLWRYDSGPRACAASTSPASPFPLSLLIFHVCLGLLYWATGDFHGYWPWLFKHRKCKALKSKFSIYPLFPALRFSNVT